MPRSAIIWTRSRELSLNVRYHRTHRTIISWSKCRPLKSSCAEAGSVIQAATAGSRAFQVCTRTVGNTPEEKNRKIKLYPWDIPQKRDKSWPPPVGAGNYAGEDAKIGDWPTDWLVIEGYN